MVPLESEHKKSIPFLVRKNMPGKEKSEIHQNIKVNLQMYLNCEVFKAQKYKNIHEDLSTNFATNSTYFLQGTKNQNREK